MGSAVSNRRNGKVSKRRRGVLTSYVYSITQVVISLVYVPLLLSGIGRNEYGLYQLVGSIISYLSIANSTFAAGATRFYCKYYALGDEAGMANTLGLLKRIYRIAYVLILVIVGIVIVAFSAVYAGSFSPWEIEESCLMLGVLAANLVLTMNNTMSIACITAHEEFSFLKLSQLATIIFQPVLILTLIRIWPFAITVTLAQLFCNFACRMVQQIYARDRLGMDDRLRFLDKDLEHSILTFSGGVVLGVIADQIFWKTDQLILGYFYGTSAVAVYSVGSQMVGVYSPLGFAVSSVFMPRISEVWHSRHALGELSELFAKVSRVAMYPLLAVLLGFIVFGQDFIHLWVGSGYEDSYWVAVIELIPFTVDLSQNIGLTILQVMNRYGFRAKMYLAAGINQYCADGSTCQEIRYCRCGNRFCGSDDCEQWLRSQLVLPETYRTRYVHVVEKCAERDSPHDCAVRRLCHSMASVHWLRMDYISDWIGSLGGSIFACVLLYVRK
jgi:O-antigen/teichoic acid export membrane protein